MMSYNPFGQKTAMDIKWRQQPPQADEETAGKVSTNAFGTDGPALPGQSRFYHGWAGLVEDLPSA